MNIVKSVKWKSIFAPRSIVYTLMGVFLEIIVLQGFMIPNNFLDGGVTGISILITGFADIHISILLIVINLPFVFIGYKKIGRTFGIQALIAILILAAGMYFIQIPPFTSDNVLIAVFGGFFIG